MCPPGYFVRSIQGRAGVFVDRLTGLSCEDPESGNTTTRTIGGSNAIGTSNGGDAFNLGCGAGSYFAGLYVRSGWYTDGFNGLCRRD